MSTRVRLTDAEEWPKHGVGKYEHRVKNWPQYRGKVVEIGPPVEPLGVWICDTDLVWPVYSLDGKPIPEDAARQGIQIYVCRHQIQAGD